MMQKKEETDDERRRREYLEERAREYAALSAKLKKLRNTPRHVLVRRVRRRWGTFRKEFSAEYDLQPKALSSVALRSLLATGQAPRPIR